MTQATNKQTAAQDKLEQAVYDAAKVVRTHYLAYEKTLKVAHETGLPEDWEAAKVAFDIVRAEEIKTQDACNTYHAAVGFQQ